jgi:hypothetical protein
MKEKEATQEKKHRGNERIIRAQSVTLQQSCRL